MRRFLARLCASMCVVLLGAACSGGAAAPTPIPATVAPTSTQVPTTAPEAVSTVAPPPLTAESASSWDSVVAAANAEGELHLVTQTGSGISDVLTQGFEQQYPGIKVDVTAGAGGDVSAKLLNEQGAGDYTTDVIIHGATTILSTLMPAGAVVPIVPYLVGPHDQDGSVWLGGSYNFADSSSQYDLVFTGGVHMPLIYNPSLASPDQLHSYRDLLDPQWQGKIAMFDPRVAGSGMSMMALFDRTPTLGRDFVQQLLGQDVRFTQDDRQLTDWIAHGEDAIGLAQEDFSALQLIKQGVPLAYIPSMEEPTYLNAGWGTVAVLKNTPDPNATRVYLDWLLSTAGQEAIIPVSGYPSRRTDASTEGLPAYAIPQPGVHYLDDVSQDNQKDKQDLLAYFKTAIPS